MPQNVKPRMNWGIIKIMGNKVAYSMFDGSGIMLLEYAKAGYQCYCFNADEGNHGEYFIKMKHENLHYVNMWIDENFIENIIKMDIPKPDIVFGFPDCTMFAQSGSKHVRSEDDIHIALQNAIMVEKVGNHFGIPWMAENPVGRLSTLWRKPDFYFNPRDFGNYLDESDGSFHPKMPLKDGYTKRTAIWCGNGFTEPERKPLSNDEGVMFFWGWKFLGGKSARTKQLRSLTPRGFARAVFESNSK